MHSCGKQMLSLALGKVKKKEKNTVSSFSNIFGNVSLQNKEVRIHFMAVYLSFFPLKIKCLLLRADNCFIISNLIIIDVFITATLLFISSYAILSLSIFIVVSIVAFVST